MKEALNRHDPLKLPEGKYYLVDAGLMLRSGLITPYRGEQYHLKEYSRNPPQNPRELFNLRHTSLRNAIERAFGVLKKRFPIISSSTEPSYGVETQKLIIFACCILHNYLRGADPNDELLAQVDAELMNDNDVHEEPPNPRESNEEFRRGELIRDGIATDIAADMWANYQAKLEVSEWRNKPIRNYDKLIEPYGRDKATGKQAETGADMVKRGARNNLRKSSDSSLIIDERYRLVAGIKKSKHDYLEGMADMLRGGMNNLANAINRLSTMPLIPENEIWQVVQVLDLEPSMHMKAYIFLCKHANLCRTLIECPLEDRKFLLLTLMSSPGN
uniref:Uncharacterized protein LOC104217199 n=1 Tax=Nicotiana sylvestris TaxID=4096 RepID=A0A1U7VTG1_NICSY|nr:PREDICTED: uncharacterized protein LOC104217199 [Nicotiana sylvestris]